MKQRKTGDYNDSLMESMPKNQVGNSEMKNGSSLNVWANTKK
jgi:hypothetical protein